MTNTRKVIIIQSKLCIKSVLEFIRKWLYVWSDPIRGAKTHTFICDVDDFLTTRLILNKFYNVSIPYYKCNIHYEYILTTFKY